MKVKEKFKNASEVVEYCEKTFNLKLSKTKAEKVLKEHGDENFTLTGFLKTVKSI